MHSDDGATIRYHLGCFAVLLVFVAVLSAHRGESIAVNIGACLGLFASMYGLGCLLDNVRHI